MVTRILQRAPTPWASRGTGQVTDIVSEAHFIDVLVNQTDTDGTVSLRFASVTDRQSVLGLDGISVLQAIQAFLPGMQQKQRGTMMNVRSNASLL